MDEWTFRIVSVATAIGGAVGTWVGYEKLRQERQQRPLETNSDDNQKQCVRVASDFTRTIGYLGFHSLVGATVYPWISPILLPGFLRRDLRANWHRDDKDE